MAIKNLKGSMKNSGFTAISDTEGYRAMNKDGSLNIIRTGLPWWKRNTLYHLMIRMSTSKFLIVVFLFYTVTNIFFASIYALMGVDKLQGIDEVSSIHEKFLQAFFFSSQTLTTVGYGHISPKGTAANIIASLESFIGIMAFAIVTGLFFARFARPRAYLKFSDNLLLTPYKDTVAFMWRIVSEKTTNLTDVRAEVTCSFHTVENGKHETKFYPLSLEYSRINSLTLSWTLVHPIDEKSPFFGMTLDDIKLGKIEIMTNIKAFDEYYSNTVQQRSSYKGNEIIYGGKFDPCFNRSADGLSTELHIDDLSKYTPIDQKDISQILNKQIANS